MPNAQITIPLSAIGAYGRVFLAKCREFDNETQLTDWYFNSHVALELNAAIAPGQGIFNPLPPGPYGLEIINGSATSRYLSIIETDSADDAQGFYSGVGAPYVPKAATRQVYILANGQPVRVVLDGTKTYLGLKWPVQDALLTGTLRVLGNVSRAPSTVAFAPVGSKLDGAYP